ncbi:MAG: carboxypeptidase-like regulatory domain-containing protein, partial [Candidatus Poribacteria bacterium]|nr:carboxypeptidase-like regulatory domain-containing protein [Candidatus Poribacteria bacterium]
MGCSQDKLEFGIEGAIVGENGQPISSAIVSIDGSENQSIAADNMGRFFIGGIASGIYQISVTKVGYNIYRARVEIIDK